MKKITFLLFFALFWAAGCSSAVSNESGSGKDTKKSTELSKQTGDSSESSNLKAPEDEITKSSDSKENEISVKQPKNVREFFMLLPREFFEIEGCQASKDKGCQKSKIDYLKKYGAVEDLKNGYMEAGGDGAQGTFKMAIFKRTNGSYVVGLNSFSETADTYKFLEYGAGKWADISIEVVPEYSSTNIYELPRNGTRILVYAKEIIEQREGFEVSKKGAKLYNLIWDNGEFSIKR